MTRDEWIDAFIDAVTRARIGFGGFKPNYRRTDALCIWTESSEQSPQAAAEEWMKGRAS